MSSKLGIKQDTNTSTNFSTRLIISINILVISMLSSIAAIPAQATSLKNISFVEQLKPNKNENDNTSLNNQLFQLVPNSSKLFSKNPESKNELESRLLEEAQDAINEVKEASKVTKETINGRTVYSYNLETIKPSGTGSNPNISGNNQIRWKLPAPKVRKVPEGATGVGIVLAFFLFTVQRRLKQVQKL